MQVDHPCTTKKTKLIPLAIILDENHQVFVNITQRGKSFPFYFKRVKKYKV
jgi:hypothetical protein